MGRRVLTGVLVMSVLVASVLVFGTARIQTKVKMRPGVMLLLLRRGFSRMRTRNPRQLAGEQSHDYENG